MIKKIIKKYCGVVLFYLAIIGVAYILCLSSNITASRTNYNNLTIGVNK